MTFTAFLLIVTSAALHALWNIIAKKGRITLPFYAAICTGGLVVWFHVQFWTPIHIFSMPWRFWAFLSASVFSDCVYCAGLILTYRSMDMVTAYPVMRSLPILLTVGFTALFRLGAPLTPLAVTGFVIVFIGALLMPLMKFSDFSPRRYLSKSMLFILTAALGTTGYTIFDSLAQGAMRGAANETSRTVLSLTYYSTRVIMLSSALWLLVLLIPSQRAIAKQYWKERNTGPVYASVAASLTYVLVLLAMNYVSNVSYVQVFRQLGLPIGMAAGYLILRERCTPVKIAGVTLILTGLTLSVLKF